MLVGGTEYTIPSVVSAGDDTTTQDNHVTYRSGDEAFQRFDDPGASARVSVMPPKSHSLRKSLPSDYQFSFYSLVMDTYSASLNEYLDFIDQKLLLPKLSKLPRAFANEPSVVAAYKAFFSEFGSHVIANATFGARCNIVRIRLFLLCYSWLKNFTDDMGIQ